MVDSTRLAKTKDIYKIVKMRTKFSQNKRQREYNGCYNIFNIISRSRTNRQAEACRRGEAARNRVPFKTMWRVMTRANNNET